MNPLYLRKFASLFIIAAIEVSPVQATNLGISYASASGEMPVALRIAIKQYEKEKDHVNALVIDAQNDSLREMEGVQNLIAAKVDAMIVAPVDSSSTQKITSMANKAGIPLVLLDASFNEKSSRRGVATVGSGDNRPGVVQMREVCRLLGGSGNVVVLTDDLVKSNARARMQEIEEVVSSPPCNNITIIERRQGGGNQLQSAEVVAGWLGRGRRIGAVVTQSDELALGAIRALKKSKQAGNIVVAGIGATPAGLASVELGEMTFTVFQDEVQQSRAAIDLAVQMANGTFSQLSRSVPASVVSGKNCAFYQQSSSGSIFYQVIHDHQN